MSDIPTPAFSAAADFSSTSIAASKIGRKDLGGGAVEEPMIFEALPQDPRDDEVPSATGMVNIPSSSVSSDSELAKAEF